MRKVKVNAWQVALVYKDGVYERMLKTGTYWIWNRNVVKYNKMEPFAVPAELNVMLEDKQLADALQVIDVKENQIVLQFENEVLIKVLTTGRYAFWKGGVAYEFIVADTAKIGITENIGRELLQHRLLAPFVRYFTVENYEKALFFVDGKYVQELGAGVYYWWKNSISIVMGKVDIRSKQVEISGQEILTKDKASLRINGQARYRVTDVQKALLENKEYDKQAYVAFQFALREYVSALTLDELLEKKETIAPFVLEAVKEKATGLGIAVSDFGIRDIILPGDVKEIMNQVLVAEKKAQANSIMRREETASTRSLLNTAKLMEENSMLWKLKEMEYVEKIAEKISNINVNGNGMLMEQLKQILVSGNTG